MSFFDKSDPRITLVSDRIKDYPDFPKKGVIFKDLFSVLADVEACNALMSLITDKAKSMKGKIDAVIGLDARGFLFGPTIAMAAGVPFLPVRLMS